MLTSAQRVFFLVLVALIVHCRGWSAEAEATRPNILLIVADDMGFSDIGCYGSEISTPNLDSLAKSGLRFTQCYNTTRCWSTRCALMTGYYPQQTHQDPHKGLFPVWARTIAQRLKPLGYRCYHSGKWHVNGAPAPVADGGFDHSYILDDHNRNFNPRDHKLDDVVLPPVAPGSGYYSSTAFADHAVKCLKEHAKKYTSQPFFSYLAFTVPHFPLQAPPEDIARYIERYDVGWGRVRADRMQRLHKFGIVQCRLSAVEPLIGLPYPNSFPKAQEALGGVELNLPFNWGALTPTQKKFQAQKMAVHAAMVDRMDQEVGRVLSQIKAMGSWENTLIMFISDNGASAEIVVRGDGHDQQAATGSAGSFLCLGPGWSNAANTPFRRHKTWVHEGGISTPLIVHWPKGFTGRNELRHDICHVIDFMPTILAVAGDTPVAPEGAPPLPGCNLVPAFMRDGAVQRDNIYFHHEGNRALRMGSYKIVSARCDGNVWELYDLSVDRGEQKNLASEQPERLMAMVARWHALDAQFTKDAGAVRTSVKQ